MSKIEIKGRNWLVIVIIAIAAVLVYFNRGELIGTKNKTNPVAGKTYSAVFLTNGQVYFGILKNATSQYLKLVDIYYLQAANQQLQPEASKDKNKQKTQLELVKLGGELHGPVDEMHINRDQVLFYEELKPDSQVVKTIEKQKQTTE